MSIYLDSASTTKVNPEIITIIKKDLEEYWGNPSNLYVISEKPKQIIEDARCSIANCIGAKPEEIFFTSGSSEGNAWACCQRNRIVCSPYEHHNLTTNLNSTIIDWNWLDQSLIYSKMHKDDSLAHYEDFLLSWMYVNNETGEIFDVKTLAKIAHELGMIYHSDMTQALGNVPISVKELDVDIATFSGHKIHAPKGIGFIYFNSDRIKNIKNLIYGGQQEKGFRPGTENVPYIDALRMAVYSAVVNRITKHNYCFNLKKLMVEELNKYGLNFIINSPAQSVANILNVSFKDISGEALMMDLSDRNIYVGVGSACNTGLNEPSEVLQEMGISEEYIRGAIRFSFDFGVSVDDIKSVAYHINELIKSYKVE